jgi:chemotaxis protein methyltransferase CheR
MSAAAKASEVSLPVSESEIDALAGLLASAAGMAPSALRLQRREAEIGAFAAAEGLADGESLLKALGQSPALLDRLIDLVTINETYFFRSNEQFARIRQELMPALRARESENRPLRLWSAGCAGGEEAYSLAIMAHEEAPQRAAKVLATDISISALAKAQRGTYGAWSFREIAPEALGPYVRPAGASYRVTDDIKAHVTFERHNLATDVWPKAKEWRDTFDLILLRNVLIYFTPDAIERTVAHIAECLAPGGWLVAGPSDPILRNAHLEALGGDGGMVYRRAAHQRRRAPTARKTKDASSVVVLNAPKPNQPPARQGRKSSKAPSKTKSTGKLSASRRAPDSPATTLAERAHAGDHAAVVEMTETAVLDQRLAELRGEALANLGDGRANGEVERLIGAFPMSARLRYLRALLLVGERRLAEAADACRELLYIEPDSASARMLQGEIQLQSGDVRAAQRSFRGVLKTGGNTGLDAELLTTDAARAELNALARERLKTTHETDHTKP